MSVWFQGEGEIDVGIEAVQRDIEDLGTHWVGVVSHMPSMSKVALVEQGRDFVTIETSEGVMKRTNIDTRVETDAVRIEFDEEYQAGSVIKTKSHFVDEFTRSGTGVNHRTTMSGVEAPGIVGFIYRKFGSSNIGNAFLAAYKAHLEAIAPGK